MRAAGLDILVLEARDRLGGRAHTAGVPVGPQRNPYALDLGCEWLHSADTNVLAALAPENGFVLDKSDPPWSRRAPHRGLGEAEMERLAAEQAAFWERVEQAGAAAQRSGCDHPAADCFDPDAGSNGFLDAISTYYSGAPWDRISVIDFDRYVDTGVNWRVRGGYGAMVAALGRDLPVQLGCSVGSVSLAGRSVRVATSQGTFEAERVIVTISTSLLAAGAIRFDPALDGHCDAASRLPLGVADKLFLHLDEAQEFEPDTRLSGPVTRRDIGAYTLRSGGRPLVEGYFGGDYARHLEAGGLRAFVAAARHEIAEALGHDIASRLTPVAATGWARDPHALGSYSHALPGHADARALLARPIDDRLWFAGEATSANFFSTAHGAWEEGTRAGGALIAAAHCDTAPRS